MVMHVVNTQTQRPTLEASILFSLDNSRKRNINAMIIISLTFMSDCSAILWWPLSSIQPAHYIRSAASSGNDTAGRPVTPSASW